MDLKNIDTWRKGHMALAELIDSWRLIPRALVAGYAFFMWKVATWYMELTPRMIEGCDVKELGEHCISYMPSTQHAVLITAVVGVSAAVLGLYSSSGRKWNGFTHWNKKEGSEEKKPDAEHKGE